MQSEALGNLRSAARVFAAADLRAACGAMPVSNPIYAACDSDDTAFQTQRRTMEAAMIDVTRRGCAMVGRPDAALLTADV